MEDDIRVNNTLIIPGNELEVAASSSGGPGGQHVNKSHTRITLRWNVSATQVFTQEQKTRVLEKWHYRLTSEGDLVIHNSESRSQYQNKEYARKQLADEVRRALYVPKKRMETRPGKSAIEKRLRAKAVRSNIKKMRSNVHED